MNPSGVTRILTPLEPSEYTRSAIHRAAEIASRAGGELVGMTVVDVEGIDEEVALPLRADLRSYPNPHAVELLEYSEAELDSVRKEFMEGCAVHGVKPRTEAHSGCPGSRIVGESRFFDLVVMGLRTNFHFATDEHRNVTLERVINLLPVPLWLVPVRSASAPVRRATVAFDGSLPSTRALHRFVPLARLWNVEVTLVGSRLGEESGMRLMEEACVFLAAHGIAGVRVDLAEDPVEEVFERRYLGESDVIVAGTRSRTVLKEFFVGSFTKKLLGEASCDLFICS